MQHVLERHVEIDRAFRQALRHFAGADHTLVERIRAGHGARPLRNRLDETFDAADAQPAIPLLFDVELGVFAERLRFTRHDHHRHFVLQGAVDAHASLQHADTGMQQHRLRPLRDQRVSGRHVDRQRLVPGLDKSWSGLVLDVLPRQRLPYG